MPVAFVRRTGVLWLHGPGVRCTGRNRIREEMSETAAKDRYGIEGSSQAESEYKEFQENVSSG